MNIVEAVQVIKKKKKMLPAATYLIARKWLSFAWYCSLFPPHCHNHPLLIPLTRHFAQASFSLPSPRNTGRAPFRKEANAHSKMIILSKKKKIATYLKPHPNSVSRNQFSPGRGPELRLHVRIKIINHYIEYYKMG